MLRHSRLEGAILEELQAKLAILEQVRMADHITLKNLERQLANSKRTEMLAWPPTLVESGFEDKQKSKLFEVSCLSSQTLKVMTKNRENFRIS